jgi:hypothetical protein
MIIVFSRPVLVGIWERARLQATIDHPRKADAASEPTLREPVAYG